MCQRPDETRWARVRAGGANEQSQVFLGRKGSRPSQPRLDPGRWRILGGLAGPAAHSRAACRAQPHPVARLPASQPAALRIACAPETWMSPSITTIEKLPHVNAALNFITPSAEKPHSYEYEPPSGVPRSTATFEART